MIGSSSLSCKRMCVLCECQITLKNENAAMQEFMVTLPSQLTWGTLRFVYLLVFIVHKNERCIIAISCRSAHATSAVALKSFQLLE